MINRIFLVVMDSFGIGALPDADKFGDVGSNTLAACASSKFFNCPTLQSMGLFNIDGVSCCKKSLNPIGCFGKMAEQSKGKDTVSGHWEISGIISQKEFQTFPDGFPSDFIDLFEKETNKKTVCNRPYSGTDVIRDFGKHHEKTGDLIVYTSADSVFQIAAHENIISVDKLYEYCLTARRILDERYYVGRVIARPFVGQYPNYKRTVNRHDFSVFPPKSTVLDKLRENGYHVLGVGKINDIFAGRGITESYKTKSNLDGMLKTIELIAKDFKGLCFTNLVDFDSIYGHRNDIDGYAIAVTEFDKQLFNLINNLKEKDLLIITADHGCDPSTESTDHSREYVPLIVYGKSIKQNINLGTRKTFADIAATISDLFDLGYCCDGESFLKQIIGQ